MTALSESEKYINLKLAALGQPTSRAMQDAGFMEMARPMLRSQHQKDQLLSRHLSPIDSRIQTFLNDTLSEACSGHVPRLPSATFVLDRPGLGRILSLPATTHHFNSAYLNSYRVPQGVLHNPKSDRRTTQGLFHIVEGGLPIPDD